MEIEAKERQTLFDLALKATGSVEGAFEMSLTSGRSLSEVPEDGETISYYGIIEPRVVQCYQAAGIDPATASDWEQACMGGIGYMCVEVDFCVS